MEKIEYLCRGSTKELRTLVLQAEVEEAGGKLSRGRGKGVGGGGKGRGREAVNVLLRG